MKEKAFQYGSLRHTDTTSLDSGDAAKALDSASDGDLHTSDNTSDEKDGANKKKTSSLTVAKAAVAYVRKNMLLLALLSSLVLGVALGCGLRALNPPLTEVQQAYLKFPGEILMNMLKLLILPLIVSSLMSGMTSLNSASSGKMVARAVCYYLCSMLLSVILGLILVSSIKPGATQTSAQSTSSGQEKDRRATAGDTFMDMIRQMFPDNLIQACFSKKITKFVLVHGPENETGQGPHYKRTLIEEDGINMLGLVMFSLAMGIAINRLGESGRPLKNLVDALAQATLQIVTVVIWYSPIGILFLVAAQIVGLENSGESLRQLGLYMATVTFGLVLHGSLVLPLLYFVLVRKNPYKFLWGMLEALVTALGTSSSSACIPVTMRNLEEKNNVDPRVVSFVIPVGATINMDGTALYEAVAAVFIGQMNGLQMGFGELVTVCFTATAAAIGAAGVPQAGLVTMVIVLESVGFPTSGIAMVLAVDWIIDRIRTVINVLGDAFGAGIVDHFSQDETGLPDPELSDCGHVTLNVSQSESHHQVSQGERGISVSSSSSMRGLM